MAPYPDRLERHLQNNKDLLDQTPAEFGGTGKALIDRERRIAELEAENKKLRASVLNQCSDNICWIEEIDVARALPEKEFLESCRRYRQKIADIGGEVQPGETLTIAELEAELARLQAEANDEGPGTPMGRINHICAFAEKELGLSPASPRGADGALLEEFTRMKAEVLEAKAVSGVCVNAFKSFQMLIEGKITEDTFNNVIKSAEKDLGHAADWLKEYVDALTVEVASLREDQERLREIITQSEMACNHPDEAEGLTPESEPTIGLCSGDDCVYCACLHVLDAARTKGRGGV